MKLYFSPTSPYVRKVMAVAVEKQLAGRISLLPVDPLIENPALRLLNPLSKVPTLVLDDGRVIFDSPVICEYLDSIGQTPRLIPQDQHQRLAVLTRQALADGLMDAAFAIVMERRRPAQQQSQIWLARWTTAIIAGVHKIASVLPPEERLDLGDIASVAALDYIQFRLPDLGVMNEQYSLQAWLQEVSAKYCFLQTRPFQNVI
jgi:glutathione S-transferase